MDDNGLFVTGTCEINGTYEIRNREKELAGIAANYIELDGYRIRGKDIEFLPYLNYIKAQVIRNDMNVTNALQDMMLEYLDLPTNRLF